jgi:hypothetical protein
MAEGSDQTQEEKLISVLRREEQEADSWQTSELTAAREESFKYYDRQPYGDEQEGQSKIVTSDYADTVESLMPSLMRVFAGTDQVVEFTPRAPGDEQAAKEASDYIPHVFLRENDGYRILYWFIKDALMYRLAWGSVDVEEVEQTKTETVPPMPADAWAVSRQALEAKAKETKSEISFEVTEEEQPSPAEPLPEMGGMLPAPVITVSGTVTVTRKVKRVVADNIAPEDGLMTPNARDIDQASMLGYRKKVTASDLRILGMEQEEIDELSTDQTTYTVEQSQRQPDVIQATSGRQNRKDSERAFWVVVAYVKFDWNDDGISETLRVVYAHAGGMTAKIIEQQEWTDGVAPVFAGSPILMSHTVPGRSLFDQVKDLQDITTVITRGILDNVYQTNRPRPVVSDKVNLSDIIDWTPGQPIRLSQGADPSGNHVQWLQAPSIIAPALSMLEHMATAKEKRTGITAYNQGLDANSLNKTATGIGIIASAAEQRMELIARTLAEGPFKRLYRLLYRAVKRAATGPTEYWDGLKWANCDPTKWPDDMNLVVDVGPGTGNKQMQMQNLMMMGQAQEKLVQAQGGPDGALIKLKHIGNTARKLGEAMGFKDPSQFVASEEEVEEAEANPKPPPPNPEMIKVQMQAEAAKAKQEGDFALAQQKNQNDIMLAGQKAQAELELKKQIAAEELNLMREKNALEMSHKREMAGLDFELKQQELLMEGHLKKYEIDNAPAPTDTRVQEQQVSA